MKKKITTYVVAGISLAVFLYAASGLINIAIDYYKSGKELKDIQEKFYHSTQEKQNNNPENEESQKRKSLQELLKENDDLVGWIRIEDTNIDYPVLKSKDNQDYLKLNFKKEYSILGSIFMDYRNDIHELDRNTIIYGHRTKNGTMFEHLSKFLDEQFIKSHPTFELDTLNGTYKAIVFSVYKTTTEFNYIQTDFSSDKEFEQFISTVKEKSLFDLNVDVSKDDFILTLSTCESAYISDDKRMVVMAKLVKKDA